jgi:DNA-binding PadR family transcriptional regulator
MSAATVQYAVLGLISSRDGIHGYQLKSEFDDRFGDFWALNYGQMYRTLDRLERTGLIAGAEVPQVGRPSRRVFRITDRGKKSLDSWLELPPAEEPRAMRDEVAVKLLFRSGERPRDLVDLVRRQRAHYLRHLSRLNKRRARLGGNVPDGFASSLLLLQADMRVRSDLAWLEVVEKEVLKRAEHAR